MSFPMIYIMSRYEKVDFLMYELQNGFRMALMTNPQSSVLKFLFLSKSFNPQFSILNPQFSGFLVFKYVIQSSILNPQFSILNPQFSILNPHNPQSSQSSFSDFLTRNQSFYPTPMMLEIKFYNEMPNLYIFLRKFLLALLK